MAVIDSLEQNSDCLRKVVSGNISEVLDIDTLFDIFADV